RRNRCCVRLLAAAGASQVQRATPRSPEGRKRKGGRRSRIRRGSRRRPGRRCSLPGCSSRRLRNGPGLDVHLAATASHWLWPRRALDRHHGKGRHRRPARRDAPARSPQGQKLDEGVRRVGAVIARKSIVLLAAFYVFVAGYASAQTKPRVVHVFVALADNAHQGIVPVPPVLGNGDDPGRNLYWGAAFGVRTFFKNAPEWTEIYSFKPSNSFVLERSVFRHHNDEVLLVADAYRGSAIKQALTDFFRAAAGIPAKESAAGAYTGLAFRVPTTADLVVYVGHDGLMDFPLTVDFEGRSESTRAAIILACASRSYFRALLRESKA